MQTSLINYSPDFLTTKAQLLMAYPMPDHKVALFFDKTNFHPVDYQWPDQPGDKGAIEVDGQFFTVENCWVGAYNSLQEIHLNDKIPVKRGTPDWNFLVAHIIQDEQQFFMQTQPQHVVLQVDADYRASLSIAHSLCHLMALALNKHTRHYWKSLPERTDSLGNPDFDSLTISKSQIEVFQSTDTYRLGKSIRKKGLNTQDIFNDLLSLKTALEDQVNAWLKLSLSIRHFPNPSLITDRRYWECDLPDGKAQIPCGGTHVSELTSIHAVTIDMTVPTDGELMIITKVTT